MAFAVGPPVLKGQIIEDPQTHYQWVVLSLGAVGEVEGAWLRRLGQDERLPMGCADILELTLLSPDQNLDD